jgi:hypothetical protein
MINLKILKTIVTKLGGVDVSEKNHVDTYTESRISNVRGIQIAYSETGGIWIEYQELANYVFLNAIVIGQNNLKSWEGCELVFLGNNFEQRLVSDTLEIESDSSNVSNRWITHIAFDITDINIDFIKNKIADTVQLKSKKIKEIFNIIK